MTPFEQQIYAATYSAFFAGLALMDRRAGREYTLCEEDAGIRAAQDADTVASNAVENYRRIVNQGLRWKISEG